MVRPATSPSLLLVASLVNVMMVKALLLCISRTRNHFCVCLLRENGKHSNGFDTTTFSSYLLNGSPFDRGVLKGTCLVMFKLILVLGSSKLIDRDV